jgi:hypothetical protein
MTCPTVFEFLGYCALSDICHNCCNSSKHIVVMPRHLSASHELSEKTVAQFQVQAHVVSQFETKARGNILK